MKSDLILPESVLQKKAAPNTSKRYQFVPTTEVIGLIEKTGWVATQASQANVKKAIRQGFQKHMVKFRHPLMGAENAQVGGLIPEIILLNSHDAGNPFKIMGGFFRMVCSNGLIVADSLLGASRIIHSGRGVQDGVLHAVEFITDCIPKVVDRVKTFQEIQMERWEREAYAEAAMFVRYGERYKEKSYSMEELLRPVRSQDAVPTLWTTFNRIQEKLITGGSFLNKKRGGKVVEDEFQTGKGIKAIGESVRVNTGLWAITERTAELKGEPVKEIE